MTLPEIKDVVKASPYSMVDFSKHVAIYMDIEWSDKFKERIYQLLSPKGHGKPSKDEQSAMEFWCEVQRDPHWYAHRYYRSKELPKKYLLLRDWLTGRRSYNRLQAKKMLDYISRLL
jgi:hypothetical protein